MGPGDPFGDEEQDDAEVGRPRRAARSSARGGGFADQEPTEPQSPIAAIVDRHLGTFILVGLIIGVAFGLAVVLRGFIAALVLGVFGGLGVGLAVAVWVAASGRIDFAAAWEALTRRGPR